MSDVQAVADRVRDALVRRLALTEDGAPFEVLADPSSGEPVGSIRVWSGRGVTALVDVRLTGPDPATDAVMVHAFAPAGTAVPHLTSDIATQDGRWTVVADLTPRVDLATEPRYLDTVYPPLEAARSRAYAIADAQPVPLPRRLQAFCSPWTAAVTVDRTHAAAVESLLSSYVDRFCTLVESGAPPVSATDLAARDRAARRSQFDPASDEVWEVLVDLVGRRSVDTLLGLVRGSLVPSARA